MAKAKNTDIGVATMQPISNFVCAMPKILSHDTVQTIGIQIRQSQTISNNNVKNLHLRHHKLKMIKCTNQINAA